MAAGVERVELCDGIADQGGDADGARAASLRLVACLAALAQIEIENGDIIVEEGDQFRRSIDAEGVDLRSFEADQIGLIGEGPVLDDLLEGELGRDRKIAGGVSDLGREPEDLVELGQSGGRVPSVEPVAAAGVGQDERPPFLDVEEAGEMAGNRGRFAVVIRSCAFADLDKPATSR